jgi:hypothetical protein
MKLLETRENGEAFVIDNGHQSNGSRVTDFVYSANLALGRVYLSSPHVRRNCLFRLY